MRYRQHRKDGPHDAISSELQKRGWLVFDVHNVDRFVDQLAVKGGRVVFIECKDGSKPPSARKVKDHQEALHTRLRRAGAEVAVVASLDDLAQFERL